MTSFELWDKGNLNLSEVKKPEMLPNEYARSALRSASSSSRSSAPIPISSG
jgi:hypothetical protein